MKKIFKSKIFAVLITAIICITGTAYAINANEITYNNTTVKGALDDLYSRSGSIQYVGGVVGNFNAYNNYVNVQGEYITANEKQATVSNDGIFTLKKDGRVKVCSMAKGHACNQCTGGRLYHNSTTVYSLTGQNEIYRCDEIDVLENDTIKYQVSNSNGNAWILGSFWIFYVEDVD